MKIGDIVSLKQSLKHQGIIKEINHKKCDNSITPTKTFYKVFWFDNGNAANHEYLLSDLTLTNQE